MALWKAFAQKWHKDQKTLDQSNNLHRFLFLLCNVKYWAPVQNLECKLPKHRIFKWKIEIKISMISTLKKIGMNSVAHQSVTLNWVKKKKKKKKKKNTTLMSQNRIIEQVYDG